MSDDLSASAEFEALQKVITALQGVDPSARTRIFESAATFLQLARPGDAPKLRSNEPADDRTSQPVGPSYPSFSADLSLSPKEFLFQKQPRSDVERIAALAYYLANYRDTPQFKTLDLTKLNTEAAQPKFSNAASSASNAVKQGYLVPTTKGQRQLSAAGERFVVALPNREEARAAMTAGSPRRRTRRASSKPKATVA